MRERKGRIYKNHTNITELQEKNSGDEAPDVTCAQRTAITRVQYTELHLAVSSRPQYLMDVSH